MTVLRDQYGNKIQRNASGDVLKKPPLLNLDWNINVAKTGNIVNDIKDVNLPVKFRSVSGFEPTETGDGIYNGVMYGRSIDLSGDWSMYLRFKQLAVVSGITLTDQRNSPYTTYSFSISGTSIYFQFDDAATSSFDLTQTLGRIFNKTKELLLEKQGNKLVVFGNGGVDENDPQSDYFYYIQTYTLASANIKKPPSNLCICGAFDGAYKNTLHIYNLIYDNKISNYFTKYVDVPSAVLIRPINTIL